MSILYQGDAGLVSGLEQGLQGLLSGIANQQMNRQQLAQNQNLARNLQGGINESTLAQILSQPGGQNFVKELTPILGPLLKEQARSQGATNWLQQNFPGLVQGPNRESARGGEFLERLGLQPDQLNVSPIEEAKSAMTNVPNLSGVPNEPPMRDSNRKGPEEQERYQQYGLESTDLEPRQETVKAPLLVQPGQFNLTDWKDEDIVRLASSPYKEHQNLANAELQRRNLNQKISEKFEERSFQLNKPLYEEVEKSRRAIIEKEIALQRIEDAIQSGDIKRFTDWAADKLGLDPLKSTQAQILDSSVKELFLSDLKTIQGGKLNQLIEENLLKAFQSIGKSPTANQEITETIYAVIDILKERNKIVDELVESYESKGIEPPRSLGKKVEDQLAPYVKNKIGELQKIRKELKSGKIRSNSASILRKANRIAGENVPPDGTKWVLAPNGQIKAIPIGRLKDAKNAGGKILNE